MEAKRNLNELKTILNGETKPLLFQKNHCKICEFQVVCKKELIEKDSLGLLSRMNEKDILRYNNKGIFTVKQLSYTFRSRKRNKRVKTKNHQYYHPLQALAIRDQNVYVYDKIDLPDTKTKVFIDMEGNSTGSFIYLIGILLIENNEEKKYSLWADSIDEENEIFTKFIEILSELDEPHIFYFGNYDSKVFKRILKLNSENNKIENIINNSTNILSLIYANLYFPTYSNGLKDIGRYLGYNWSSPNSSGIQSIVWRKKWEKNNDVTIKEKLINYNYEDCFALKRVTDFIYEIFDKKVTEKTNKRTQTIAFVDEIKANDDEKLRFKNLEAVTKDIEVINKCAYFEYQRNKIFFRTNKNIKKIVKESVREIFQIHLTNSCNMRVG